MTHPVLSIHGGDDAVSPIAAVRTQYSRGASLEAVVIAGGRHDILNDQSHRTVAATVVLFLERLRLRLGDHMPSIAEIESP